MRYFLLIVLLCVSFSCSDADSPAPAGRELSTRVVATGLDTPWEILWGPDNKIWVTERKGIVSRIDPATGEKQILLDITGTVLEQGEAGLMGMALHPDFDQNPYVFLAYTYSGAGTTVKIVRYDYTESGLQHPVTLLDGIRGNVIHDGCRLIFASDKTLFITTGDAANQSLPQQLSSLNGKILRINPDGTIPSDNPQSGSPVWSFGHRNSQGLVFGPGGILYSSEHGPDTDDEINIIDRGKNYGWPNVHGFCDKSDEKSFCTSAGVIEPVTAWTTTIMMPYRSGKIPCS
jgi:PQQ-dependent dehydrogenase (s-GDH family)